MNAFERIRYRTHRRFRKFMSGDVIEYAPDRTLVIVDMQSKFMYGNEDEIVPSILELIRHAKQNEWAIIVVEFINGGDTDSAIIQALDGYPHKETVRKRDQDGGSEIIECINRHNVWSLNLLVCGLYGNECVSQTVSGLFDVGGLVEIDVVVDAVYPLYCSSSEEDEHGQQREREITLADICNCNSIV